MTILQAQVILRRVGARVTPLPGARFRVDLRGWVDVVDATGLIHIADAWTRPRGPVAAGRVA